MRYLVKISYNGKSYSGFQVQKGADTIQARLENAMSIALKTNINLVSSGRTDAGVSALEQFCHFDMEEDVDANKKVGYINSLLSRDIRVLDIEKCSEDFHARYSAKCKTYEYYFYYGAEIPIYEDFATNIGYNVDINRMLDACKFIQGEHDFTSFCAVNTEVQNKVRTIYDIDIKSVNNNLYKLVITGSGFLYNMVRIIMGTLVSVGIKKIEPYQIKEIIDKKDRSLAGKTMPAKGLILKNISY